MDKFWQFRNTASPGVVELLLYGEIQSERPWYDFYHEGSGIYADEFIKDLQSIGDVSQITCRINSVGGDIFAAIAIYTQLRLHAAKVVSIVDGIAASAATLPMLAADEIQISTGGMVMIHDPLTVLMGMYKADELTKLAGTLGSIKDSIAAIYTERTKTSNAKVADLMSAETWMTADQAVELGFADKKIADQVETSMKGSVLFMNKVKHDLSKFKNVPDLEHAQNITDAITSANAGGSIVAQFVAMAAKKASSEDDPDDDGDPAGDNDDDGDGKNAKTKNKTKNKVKDEQEEIDDDDAEDDAEDGDAKDKKAKKAVKNLVAKYPKLTNLIVKNAKAEERQRLQDIDAISNKVSPALLNKAKYEDCTTAKDLAFEQMKASSANSVARASSYVAAFTADTQASGVKSIGSDPNGFVDVQPEQERVNLGTLIAGAANKILGR